MWKFCAFSIIWSLLCCSGLWAADPSGPAAIPSFNKQSLENYLRYAEGYLDSVKVVADDPKPTASPAFFRVTVHLSSGDYKQERSYYVTADGKYMFNGSIWDLHDSPFQETLQKLPSEGFSFGPEKAKVQIVVFSDFQCPYCREFAHTVRQNLREKYPDTVRVLFQDFPLSSMHPWARPAAEAGQCAGSQNPAAFWAFHDWIFEHQGDVTKDNVVEKTAEFAKDQKLDVAKFSACMASHTMAGDVEKGIAAGRNLQVQQTPTFFVNGRMEPGAVDWKTLEALIQLELNRPRELAQSSNSSVKR